MKQLFRLLFKNFMLTMLQIELKMFKYKCNSYSKFKFHYASFLLKFNQLPFYKFYIHTKRNFV